MITSPELPAKLVSQVEAEMRRKDIRNRVQSTKFSIYAQKSVTLTLAVSHNNFALEPDAFYMNADAMINKKQCEVSRCSPR